MLAVRGQCDRAYVIAAAEQPRNDEIRMTNDEARTSTKRAFSFTIPSSHNAVMLSKAKHLRLFCPGATRNENDQRFFARVRMTVSKLLRYSTIRHPFVIRHSW